MREDLTRVTVNLIPQSVEALKQATEIEENNRTDTINRALQLYAFLVQKTLIDGWTMLLCNQDGDVEEVKII